MTPTSAPDDPLTGALTRLLRASTTLHPDDLPAEITTAAAALGATAAAIYLADLDQVRLRRLEPSAPATAHVLDVDTTPAGEAFRTVRPVVEPRSDLTLLWLPLLDSADRIGVLGAALPDRAPAVEPFEVLALLVAELAVSKSDYGDSIELTRRSAPVDLAAERRWALLPPLNLATDHVTVSAILQPGHGIAGDAFDYGLRGDDLSILVIDAMGHGEEASRIADVAIATYRNRRRAEAALAEILRAMDAAVASAFGEDRFVTAQTARLDLRTGHLHILNAGHPPPILFRANGAPHQLECRPCLPVGMGSVPAVEADHRLEPGDAVLFYTDGVVEARDHRGDQYGLDRLLHAVAGRRDAGLVPAEVLRQVIHETLAHQSGTAADDASMLLVGWTGPRAQG